MRRRAKSRVARRSVAEKCGFPRTFAAQKLHRSAAPHKIPLCRRRGGPQGREPMAEEGGWGARTVQAEGSTFFAERRDEI